MVRRSVCVVLLAAAGGVQDCRGSVPVLDNAAERVCVSLQALAREAVGHKPDKNCLEVCGLSYLEGYVMEDGGTDVILVGRRDPRRPPIHLDDVVVFLRHTWSGEAQEPGCSLDPAPESIRRLQQFLDRDSGGRRLAQDHERRQFVRDLAQALGPQRVRIDGVPRDTRLAHVMIDTDYHMKKVSQGHAQITGIPSCIQRSLAEGRSQAEEGEDRAADAGMSMSRFWFACKDRRPTFLADAGIVWIDQCIVTVKTEREMLAADAELRDDQTRDDPHAEAFARDFTAQYQQAVREVPEFYADLENLYRLRALILALHFRQGSIRDSLEGKADLQNLLDEGRYRYQEAVPMEPDLPALANVETLALSRNVPGGVMTSVLSALVCGGVAIDTRVTEKSFPPAAQLSLQARSLLTRLPGLRAEVLMARPGPTAMVWPLRSALLLPAVPLLPSCARRAFGSGRLPTLK